MRILICIASMASGGAERQATYLAKGLVASGHDVHVALIKRGTNYERLFDTHATIHIVNIYPNTFKFVLPLLRLFRTVKPDVIYLWQRPFDVLGGLAALLAGIPAVHAERTDPRNIEYGPKVWLRNFIVSWSSAVIANSNQGYSYWHQKVRSVLVVKIPNIVPYEEMQLVQPSAESTGSIVMLCRLDANKNVITLLRAINLLKQKGLAVNVILVGNGDEFDNLKRYAEDQGISSQIKFAGYRSDAWDLLKGSKAFVSLSFYEGEPNVVLEAAALGCRLIISDIPAHRSLECLSSMTFVNPTSEFEVANALELLHSEETYDAGTANAVSYLNPEWAMRSLVAVSRQHLEIFSQITCN